MFQAVRDPRKEIGRMDRLAEQHEVMAGAVWHEAAAAAADKVAVTSISMVKHRPSGIIADWRLVLSVRLAPPAIRIAI